MRIIGIDAGATWLKAGRFNEHLELEESVQVVSGAARGVAAYFDTIVQVVSELGGADAVGLALPGTLSRDQRGIQYAANIPGLTLSDQAPVVLTEVLGGRLGTSNLVGDNDAACAALAEWQLGAGRGAATLLQITWGTGIGTALVVKGESQYGWEGGHMPVTWSERAPVSCSCGSVFDLEAFIAVPHLEQRSGLVAEELLQQAQAGVEPAASLIQESLRWLARGIHMMSVLVYPDTVVIGGGFMASDWLLEQLRVHVQQEAGGYLVTTLRPEMVQRAQLANEAGMIGAALLAKKHFG